MTGYVQGHKDKARRKSLDSGQFRSNLGSAYYRLRGSLESSPNPANSVIHANWQSKNILDVFLDNVFVLVNELTARQGLDMASTRQRPDFQGI